MIFHCHKRSTNIVLDDQFYLPFDSGVWYRVHHLGRHRSCPSVFQGPSLLRSYVLLPNWRHRSRHSLRPHQEVSDQLVQVYQPARHLQRHRSHPPGIRDQLYVHCLILSADSLSDPSVAHRRSLDNCWLHLPVHSPTPPLRLVGQV